MALQLTSTAFTSGAQIPSEYTCQGRDRSPHLSWQGAPANTKAWALILEDPDSPGGTFTHWLIYDLPGGTAELAAGVPSEPDLPDGARQGRNSFGKIGYGGPCPPSGPAHRYYFHLYALDAPLNLPSGASKQSILDATRGHILGEAELMGRFAR